MNRINQGQLAEVVRDSMGVSHMQANKMISEVVSAIAGALASGHSVALRGLGTFEVRQGVFRQGKVRGYDYAVQPLPYVKLMTSEKLRQRLPAKKS